VAEASSIIHLQPSFVIVTLARFAGRKVVKHQLRAKGLKVVHYAPRDLSPPANYYLAQYRDALLRNMRTGAVRPITP
jgi:hypothetical protein